MNIRHIDSPCSIDLIQSFCKYIWNARTFWIWMITRYLPHNRNKINVVYKINYSTWRTHNQSWYWKSEATALLSQWLQQQTKLLRRLAWLTHKRYQAWSSRTNRFLSLKETYLCVVRYRYETLTDMYKTSTSDLTIQNIINLTIISTHLMTNY